MRVGEPTDWGVYGVGATTVTPMVLGPRLLAAAGAGYVIGLFPSADVAARLAGGDHDLRAEGTGNPGGMNTAHVLGRRWGAAVAGADVAKGTVAAGVGRRLAGAEGASVAGSAAVVGHCLPFGRRGGKGVATSVGQVIGTVPAYLPLDMVVGYATTKLPWFRHRTRAATHVASAVWVSATALWWRRQWPNPGADRPTWALPAGAALSSAVIAARFTADADRVAAFEDGRVDPGDDGEVA